MGKSIRSVLMFFAFLFLVLSPSVVFSQEQAASNTSQKKEVVLPEAPQKKPVVVSDAAQEKETDISEGELEDEQDYQDEEDSSLAVDEGSDAGYQDEVALQDEKTVEPVKEAVKDVKKV